MTLEFRRWSLLVLLASAPIGLACDASYGAADSMVSLTPAAIQSGAVTNVWLEAWVEKGVKAQVLLVAADGDIALEVGCDADPDARRRCVFVEDAVQINVPVTCAGDGCRLSATLLQVDSSGPRCGCSPATALLANTTTLPIGRAADDNATSNDPADANDSVPEVGR